MGLTKGQVLRLVDYIGVCGGYLGTPESLKFSYRTHCEFYPVYCDLDSINPDDLQGTTRERFIEILSKAEPKIQAKIIRGVLKKFHPHCTIPDQAALEYSGIPTNFGIQLNERLAIQEEFILLAQKLEINSLDAVSNVMNSSTALEALRDAQILLKERGPQYSIDRVHTVFHAFLISICKKYQFAFSADDMITTLFKTIKENHPVFNMSMQKNSGRIVKSIATLVDAFNPIRNKQSLAHPNDDLLNEDEAQFIIDVAVACTQYIAKKVN